MPMPTRALALALALFGATAAHAGDAVTDALQEAYAPYRVALFRTSGKSQDEAQQAVAQAQMAWRSMAERLGAKPAAPYDRDAEFAARLAQVNALYERAAAAVRANRLAEAHEELESVRELLADLRRRNGVVVFSDHMNAYHAEMERLLVEAPKALDGPSGTLLAMSQVGALDYLAHQLRLQAPAPLQRNAEFEGLLKDVEASVQTVKAALLRQDAAAVRDALGKLKPAYSRLFVRFG
jgi:hypothetical protein